ncbi:hypothetical protein HQ524_02535 [Candidatus Uhrbacteria bacterium]|nr:hypothetical protein [Candidatus Uhrbacteria bacterium]
MAEEITTREIFDTLVGFAKSTEENFSVMKSDMAKLDVRVTSIESNMVTKHYFDDKLANLRGELIQI